MNIYLDAEYRCHLTNDGTMKEAETDFFDGKCAAFIEGYCFIPVGESWTDGEGVVFRGEMIAPVEDYSALAKAQAQHELDEAQRWGSLDIPQEQGMIATRNYHAESFLAVQGHLYETTRAIPAYTSINSSNVVKTTIEHYLESIKEE